MNPTDPLQPLSLRSIARAGAISALLGAGANLTVYAMAKNGFRLPLLLAAGPDGPQLAPLAFPAVLASSVVPAIAAAAFVAILSRFTRRALRIFQVLGAAVLALSFIPLASMPVDSGATRVVLGLMHLFAAAAIVGGISFFTRPPAAAASRGDGRRRWEILPTALLGLMFAFPAVSKLGGHPWIVQNFTAMGQPVWLVYVLGAIQMTGLVMLVFPRWASFGALAIAASAMHSLFLHSTHFEGWTLIAGPTLQLAFATFVAWANWSYRGQRPALRAAASVTS